MPEQQHTPTLYFLKGGYLVDGGGRIVLTCFSDEATADFVRRACNSHDALLAALRAMMDTNGVHGPCTNNDCLSCDRAYTRARAAFADATEPAP